MELLIGVTLLFNFPYALKNLFGINYTIELDIIGITLGLYLLVLTTLLIISAVWIRKGNKAGTTIAIVVGGVLLIFGILSYFQLGRTDGLMGDSTRGLLTIILAYITSKELKKNKSIQ